MSCLKKFSKILGAMESDYFKTVRARSAVDYLFRTVHQHHSQLSQMADQKANILIAASFVILSLSLGYVQRPVYRTGLLTLMVFIVIAASLAILAVMPTFKQKKNGKSNPLFFGHFAPLSEKEFMNKMEEIASEDSSLYEALTRDLYQLGKSLYFTKYRYLRWSYRCLLVGVTSFMVLIFLEIKGII
ncbi:Pycsar system effector family protein [Leptospira sp. SA-E8]